MATLSLAMIVKNEGEIIQNILGCAKPFCDEIIVVDTGSTDDTVAKAQAMGAQIHHFTWIDDFAAARNFAFSKATKDWIMWLDADDIITPENQQKILELKTSVMDSNVEVIWLNYLFGAVALTRERIIRRELFGTALKWREPIHEYIDGVYKRVAKEFLDISIQHTIPPGRIELKKDRNINILRKYIQSGANDERTHYQYVCECLRYLHKEEAKPALEKYFAMAKDKDARYQTYMKLHHFHMRCSEPQAALEALFKAALEHPERAEAYYKIGVHIANTTDNPQGAIPMLEQAASIKMSNAGSYEIDAYTYGPPDMLCRVYFRLGEYDKAKEMAKKALEHAPPAKAWLEQVVACNPLQPTHEPLPEAWQKWVSEVLDKKTPRHSVILKLEQQNFTPNQILTGLRAPT